MNATIKKQLYTELMWLVIVVLVAVCADKFFLIADGSSSFDLNLHDTYFVTKASNFYFVDIVVIGFISYLARATIMVYKSFCTTLILVIFNVLAIWMLAPFFIQLLEIIKPNTGGWTIYPPLSALPKAEPLNINLWLKSFVLTEVSLTLLLCFNSIMFGLQLKVKRVR
jgi:heme/copper-type cytochrome/quinol oxidase subunit 1